MIILPEMEIYVWIWIILYNSWYKCGMGKADLKVLNIPCGAL